MTLFTEKQREVLDGEFEGNASTGRRRRQRIKETLKNLPEALASLEEDLRRIAHQYPLALMGEALQELHKIGDFANDPTWQGPSNVFHLLGEMENEPLEVGGRVKEIQKRFFGEGGSVSPRLIAEAAYEKLVGDDVFAIYVSLFSESWEDSGEVAEDYEGLKEFYVEEVYPWCEENGHGLLPGWRDRVNGLKPFIVEFSGLVESREAERESGGVAVKQYRLTVLGREFKRYTKRFLLNGEGPAYLRQALLEESCGGEGADYGFDEWVSVGKEEAARLNDWTILSPF